MFNSNKCVLKESHSYDQQIFNVDQLCLWQKKTNKHEFEQWVLNFEDKGHDFNIKSVTYVADKRSRDMWFLTM